MESSTSDPIRKLLAFQPSGRRPATSEIRAHVRRLIKDGTLPRDIRIPSTKALAAAWGVFPNTVQLSLDPLVKEGLLDRRQMRGTFVLDGHRKIQRLGIYENFGDISASDRDFMVSLQIELSRILEKKNAELKVWIDNRRAPMSLPENMVEACRKREIDGVLCIHPRRKIIKSLRNLPVPVAALTWIRECPGQVDFRYDELVEMSLRRLADRGSKRVGAITNMGRNDHFNRPDVSNFYEWFNKTASALGLETRPEWVINPPLRKGTLEIERFGYESMKALWSLGPRPDGLFIFPHTAVRGSLTALLELSVNIPDDLKLVAHGNIETPTLTPYPVDWITSSSREIDQAMVDQIQEALDGHPTKTIWLKHRPAW